MVTKAAMALRHFRPRPVDPEALARDPLGRGLFGEVADERPVDAMTESERNEAWLRESLATVRALPVPEAMAVVREAREAYRYTPGTHHVVLDAVQATIEARAAREGEVIET